MWQIMMILKYHHIDETNEISESCVEFQSEIIIMWLSQWYDILN